MIFRIMLDPAYFCWWTYNWWFGILITLFVPVFLDAVYCSILECSPWQATIGKMLCGIHVVDSSCRRITVRRALARHLSKVLSSLPLMAGFIAAGLTERKQCFHDMIARTYVLKDCNPALLPSKTVTVTKSYPLLRQLLIVVIVGFNLFAAIDIFNLVRGNTSTYQAPPYQAPSDITVTGNGQVWVDVNAVSTGRSLYSGFLESGDHRYFDDPKGVRVRTRNGGNVTVETNGITQTLGTPGTSVDKVFTTKH